MDDLTVKMFIIFLSISYILLSLYENKAFLLFKLKKFFHKKINQQNLLDTQSSHDIIQLIVKPKNSDFFDAARFESGIKQLGLIFGEDKFFHKMHAGELVYSVCHLYPPGTFAQYQMDRSSYSGCKFFLVISSNDFNSFKFDNLLKDSQYLADHLDAVLIDEVENQLTNMSIAFIKQKIALRSYYKSLLQE
jgi:FtsZ-interacting cell division protein ZipA